MTKPIIYLDMDGVITDFQTSALEAMLDNVAMDDARMDHAIRTVLYDVDVDDYYTVNFLEQVEKAYGYTDKPLKLREFMTKCVAGAGATFWVGIKLFDASHEIVSAVGEIAKRTGAEFHLLTSPANHIYAVEGKKRWFDLYKDSFTNPPQSIIVDTDKAKYAKPWALLIDDHQANLDAFRKTGCVYKWQSAVSFNDEPEELYSELFGVAIWAAKCEILAKAWNKLS
jgi:hypothetical protein